MDKCILISLRQSGYVLKKNLAASVTSSFHHLRRNGSHERRDYSQAVVAQDKKPSSKTLPSKSIDIPVRIERGPTDILKALASTVRRDYTAPNYKFHDDPYLIPTSNVTKRSYALSKESGRKAAKWVRQQHPELYYHKNSDPPVMSFFPDPTIEDASELTESTVVSFINLGLLAEAVKAYHILEDKGIEISHDVKQSLLEMVSFYNEAEPIDEEFLEERWYQSSVANKDRLKNTWKEKGLAEQIFQKMNPQDSRAYNALIQGRAKYYSAEKASQLYEEALSKELKIDVETFNSVLTLVPFLRENFDLRVTLIKEILLEMEKQGVQPNVGTLNASMLAVSFSGNFKIAKDLLFQLLAEFNRIGVQPSLGSYFFLLVTFCRERGPQSTILLDILDHIGEKSFTIQHPKDTSFFLTAMDVARRHLQDLDAAKRVHKLLLTGNNYDLIGDSFKESVYYRHFMILAVNLDLIENFFEFYNKIVPNVYTPEPAVMEEILKIVELNGAPEYIPQLWSDIITFDHTRRESIMSLLLQILANQFPSRETEMSVKLGDKFAEIAWQVYVLLESQDMERTNVIYWSGKMLGDVMTVLVKSEDLKKASEIMKKLLLPSQKVLGVATMESLKIFLESCMKSGNSPMGLACIQYASDSGYPEVPLLAEDLFSQVKLDSVQVARLNNIVGFDVSASKSSSAESSDTS